MTETATNGNKTRARTEAGIYRVRLAAPNAYVIGLPRQFGEKLNGKMFSIHVVDDGLLFTPVDADQSSSVEELESASWLK